MPIATLLTGATALLLATSALAQDVPADPPADETEAPFGLSDLSNTVNALSDETPVQPAPDEAAPEAAEAPPSEAEPAEAAPQAAEETPAPAQPSPPAASSGPPPPISAEQRAELERSAARGRQLFAVARAGLLATQDMLSRVADPEAAGISGWVAEPEGNAMAVTFYSNGESGPAAVYRARVLGGRVVSRDTYLTGERPPLTGLALRQARARDLSASDDQSSCTGQPFNVIAFPPENAEAPIDVYRISPPASRNRLPMGGHFRTTVAADGSLSESRAFSRGCLNVELSEVPAGSQAGPIAITHLLDPLPTEMHVFLSLFSGRPLVVAAGDPTRLFMVAGDAVREIRR